MKMEDGTADDLITLICLLSVKSVHQLLTNKQAQVLVQVIPRTADH